MPKKASPKKSSGKENQDDQQLQQQQDPSEKENNDATAKPAAKPTTVQDTASSIVEKEESMDTEEIESGKETKKRKHDEELSQNNNSDDENPEEKEDSPDASNDNADNEASTEHNDNEDDAKPAAKKITELPPDFDLTQPIKKARTAYFIFMEARRPEVQEKLKGEGVAKVAKELGHIWSTMPAEEKEEFYEKAALEREQVAQKLEQLAAAGIDLHTLPGAATATAADSGSALTFPVARMRKICKLDPEVKGLSKEALVLVTKCTELMTSKLGIETVRVAQIQNRRKLLPEDIAQICGTREQFLFLREDVKDLVREQVIQNEKDSKMKPSTKSQAAAAAASNSKPLTSYFSAAK